MRIMFNKNTVEEIIEIIATPCWNPENGTRTSEDNPEMYVVYFQRFITQLGKESGLEECDCVGKYNLDGTKETYEKAKKNFEDVCEKLLIQGWCRDTDFENFEWF